MPSELRHLLFQPAEVVRALTNYHRRIGLPLPAGTIVSCGPETVVSSGTARFRLRLTQDRNGGAAPQDFVIEGPALAAALILHCRDRGIPLPASAGKSLECIGNQICLTATSSSNQGNAPPLGQIPF
ncbi:MAG: hypothetical protein NVSMB18_03730 [Acetobacteraceae bacterium]